MCRHGSIWACAKKYVHENTSAYTQPHAQFPTSCHIWPYPATSGHIWPHLPALSMTMQVVPAMAVSPSIHTCGHHSSPATCVVTIHHPPCMWAPFITPYVWSLFTARHVRGHHSSPHQSCCHAAFTRHPRTYTVTAIAHGAV